MTDKVEKISARQVLDSRGNPTIYTNVKTSEGNIGFSCVPSGASTGSREALEMRDNDPEKFNGKGVLKAIENILEKISPLLHGLDVNDIQNIDSKMIELDGTEFKSQLGANAILGVSMACTRASAMSLKIELFELIRNIYDSRKTEYNLPNPMFNVLNGGSHAFNSTDFQEYMVVPNGFDNFEDSISAGFQIYNKLKTILESKNLPTTLGDEGGFAPPGFSNEDPLILLTQAISKTSYQLGKEINFALDVAASEFYDNSKNKYNLKSEKKEVSASELTDIYASLIDKFPIYSIEDALSEDDWDGWKNLTNTIGDNIQLVGDDLYVTQKKFLTRGINEKAGNSILIKLNQVGTVSETLENIKIAQANNFETIISHRSGETEDTFIADLAVGTDSTQIKTGAPARGERVNKYNRLLLISDIIYEKYGMQPKVNSIGKYK
ncbi:MAG: phosphopyruvate hydratase [Chloroflexi bacterium]|nr:phosphopyruvate hydratase [Chloroflexota bacterium]|tara:strand:+ start:133 stop:1443 length:1311 start_codon:yes stop_codon:yes gene_type:complete